SPQIDAARRFGLPVNVVLLGPVTLLHLWRATDDRLAMLPRLISADGELIAGLPLADGDFVQLEEPVASVTLDAPWRSALQASIGEIAERFPRRVLVTCCFGDNTRLLQDVLRAPIAGVPVDATTSGAAWDEIDRWHTDKVLALGVIDGRQPWRVDLRRILGRIRALRHTGAIHLTTSCSLLHSPYDVALETSL